jgi:hypothetical protein
MDLGLVTALVQERRPFWETQGIELIELREIEYRKGEGYAMVGCERSSAVALLVVWTDGAESGADLTTGPRDSSDEGAVQQYKDTSESGLRACLDDLTKYLVNDGETVP